MELVEGCVTSNFDTIDCLLLLFVLDGSMDGGQRTVGNQFGTVGGRSQDLLNALLLLPTKNQVSSRYHRPFWKHEQKQGKRSFSSFVCLEHLFTKSKTSTYYSFSHQGQNPIRIVRVSFRIKASAQNAPFRLDFILFLPCDGTIQFIKSFSSLRY